jgi:hypothetical protein
MPAAASRRLAVSAVAALAALAALASTAGAAARPAWLRSAKIVVRADLANQDCRTGVCKHNENTDLARWRGAIWFVHRTAGSQILGPNSSLRVYRSKNGGASFALQAIIPAPVDRDIRDPSFYFVGKRMHIKAITRLPGFALRDQNAGSISVEMHSGDGRTWTRPRAIGPVGWGFWRVVRHKGTYYSAAYQDGDLQVVLYRSTDGSRWRAACSGSCAWTATTSSCSASAAGCAPRSAGRTRPSRASAARRSWLACAWTAQWRGTGRAVCS